MQEDYEDEQMYLNSSDNEDNIMDKKMKKIYPQTVVTSDITAMVNFTPSALKQNNYRLAGS